MKIKPMFNNVSECSIADYMFEKGIENPYDFKKGHTVIDWCEDWFTDAIKMIEDNKNKPFFVLVDSDVDGYTSASIVMSALNTYGIPAKPIIHTGKEHGVGDIIDRDLLVEDSVMIIPDAGIDNFYIDTFDAKNILTIVLDHHEIEKYINDFHDDKHLLINNGEIPQSGAVVAMKFAHALIGTLDSYYYELAMLGNTADVMSQTYLESRAINLVGYYPEHLFLAEMYNALNEENEPFNLEYISWKIAPKLNAVIRGTDQELKMEMFKALCTEQYEFDLVERLKAFHEKQKRKVKSIAEKVEVDESHNVIIAFPKQDDEVSGINGLIAARLESKYNKPVFAVAEEDGVCRGSCRSPFPVREMCVQSGVFDKAQGHGSAFGVAFTKENIDNIYKYFDGFDLGDAEEVEVLCEAVPRQITHAFIDEFNQDFFGKGIERPQIYIKPFTFNLKNIRFTNKFKTSVSFEIHNQIGEHYDINWDFISKVKRLELGLGTDKEVKIGFLVKPKVKYEGKRKVRILQVDEVFIEPAESEEMDW